MRFKELLKKREDYIKQELSESKLSRVWQHVEGDKSFAFVSANRSEYSDKENKKRSAQLKQDIRKLKLGFIEMKGGFVETSKDKDGKEIKVTVEEDSFLIPNISKKDVIMLGNKYEQDSVLFKDKNQFLELATKDNSGKVLTNFKLKSGKENLNFSKEIISNFFSRLKYGSHKDKKFVFNLKENQKIKTYTGYIDNWINIL